MMEICKAKIQDFQAVRSFYHELIDTADYTPMWEKDVFPDNDDLYDAIGRGGLFVGICDGKIVASVSVYQERHFARLNLLGVLPVFSRRGFARQMVSFVIGLARSNGLKAVRLNVLEGNTAAEQLYLSMGFQFIDCFEEYYDRTGLMIFKNYELIL